MATLGQTATPGSGWFFEGINVANMAYSLYTVPSPGIYVSDVNVYFDVNSGGPATAYVGLWNDSTGHLLQAWAIGSVPNGSHSPGGQAWHSASAGSLYLAAGTIIRIGLWVNQSNGFVTSTESGGSSYTCTNPGSSPGNLGPGTSTGFGALGAYIDYTPLAAPTISSVSPAVAPPGTPITITGTGFLHATGVSIGGTGVSYTIASDTQITCNVPSGASGTVGVIVTNPAGSSASYAIIAGTTEADNGAVWATGVLFAADDGTTWHTTGAQMWADDGANWHQIG